MNKRKWTKNTYLDREQIHSTNLLFRKGNRENTSVTVCLTIDDTSDVKISFYFRQQDRHSSINNNRKENKKETNFNSPNWFPFREHDLALFQLNAEGILLFPHKAEKDPLNFFSLFMVPVYFLLFFHCLCLFS